MLPLSTPVLGDLRSMTGATGDPSQVARNLPSFSTQTGPLSTWSENNQQ